MVGKIPLKAATHEEAATFATNRITSQAYGCLMARIYRYFTIEFGILNAPPIFYLPPSYYILKEPFNGVRHIYAEPELPMTDKEFIKYTNNGLFCISQSMASFSHFTHVISDQHLMITDL